MFPSAIIVYVANHCCYNWFPILLKVLRQERKGLPWWSIVWLIIKMLKLWCFVRLKQGYLGLKDLNQRDNFEQGNSNFIVIDIEIEYL